MDIGFIIWTIFVFFLGGDMAFYFIYSPKARIRNYWKKIHDLNVFISPEIENAATNDLAERGIEEFGMKINFILKYDFDAMDDAKYIEKNKWEKGKK